MPETNDLQKLNPYIADAIIGVRNMRTIKLYPLSIADQITFTDLITKALQGFTQKGDMEDIAFVGFLVELIKDNLDRLLKLVAADESGDLLSEITDVQGVAIAEIIYDVNYGEAIKNAKSLIMKVKSLFQLVRPSQPSLSDTVATVLKTSSENPIEMEEPPLDN
jgi:hypothetical protein